MSLLSISAAPYPNNGENGGTSSGAGSGSLTSIGKAIERKKMFNKTYRNHNQPLRSEKVNSVLQSIHSRPADADDDDEGSTLENFESANYAGAQPSSFRNPYESIYPENRAGAGAGAGMDDPSIVRSSMGRHQPKNPYSDNTPVPSTFFQEGMQNVRGVASAAASGGAGGSGALPSPMSNDALQLQELRSNFLPKYEWNTNGVRADRHHANSGDSGAMSASAYPMDGATMGTGSRIGDAYYDSQKTTTDKLNYIITLLEEQQDQRTNHVTEEIVLYSFLGVFMIFIVDSFVRVGKYVR